MAAYAAAVSLLRTLSQLENTPNYPNSQISTLYEGVDSLRCFLADNREVKRDFEIQIRDAIFEAEDIIDSDILSTHFLSTEAEIRCSSHQDLQRVIQKIYSLVGMTTEELIHTTLDRKISASVWKEADEIECLDFYKMVGREQDLIQLAPRMIGAEEFQVVPIVGIAGMGKTTLAQWIYDYLSKLSPTHFVITARVAVPTKYKKRDVLLGLLKSMKKMDDGIRQMTDDHLAKHLYNSLKHKTYLVFLDNIREVAVWNDLKELFPKYHNGSRILLTTRNVDVACIAGAPHQLDRISDEDTLALIESMVFGGEPCPQELLVIAKDIAQSCRGHPNAAAYVARLLRCALLIGEYWEIVLSSINTCENYDDIMKAVLSLNYKHLPQQLKACLLYIAVFPYDYHIPILDLVDMWAAEGFIELDKRHSSSKSERSIGLHCRSMGLCCLEHLFSRGLLFFHVKNGGEENICRAHDEVLHDFIMRTAQEEKFFLVLNEDTSYSFLQDETTVSTYNQQRRLCIHKNIPRAIKDLTRYNYSETCTSTTRSVLYYGPEHQYPLRVWLDLKLLKVLDALKIRFYCFPPEILKSIQLRYLALSYNGQLPEEVCELMNLQVLIVLRYLNVKQLCGTPLYLPNEIWNMKELRHLRVMGSNLPDTPSESDLYLEDLLELLDVGTHSCTPQIFKRIPSLLHLGVRIESLSEDESLSFFSDLHILKILVVFECVVMCPDIGSQVVPCSIPAFPSSLLELTLSGCGFPWEYISVIASLPNLRRLKLHNYAFEGPDWKVKKDEFPSLFHLQLEDMDLKNWILTDELCFQSVKYLIIRHCYKIRDIPLGFADSSVLKELEVVECSTSAMNSALEIKKKLSQQNASTEFYIYTSLLDD